MLAVEKLAMADRMYRRSQLETSPTGRPSDLTANRPGTKLETEQHGSRPTRQTTPPQEAANMAATRSKPTVKGGSKSSSTSKPTAAKGSKTKGQKEVVIAFEPDAKRPDTQPDDANKGALRFSEPGDDTLVGTLYLRKAEAKRRFGKLPTGAKVTIEPTFD